MIRKQFHFMKWPAYSVFSACVLFGSLASAQSAPAPTQYPAQTGNGPAQAQGVDRDNDRGNYRHAVVSFYDFLNQKGNDQIADQLRKSPALANDPAFLQQYPALQTYLQNHPEVREQLQQNPDGFMQQEEHLASRKDAPLTQQQMNNPNTRREVASFSSFLSDHPQIADTLRANPSAADDPQYLKDHPELQAYLQDNPAVRRELERRPDGFMLDEENYAKNPSTTSPQSGQASTQPGQSNGRSGQSNTQSSRANAQSGASNATQAGQSNAQSAQSNRGSGSNQSQVRDNQNTYDRMQDENGNHGSDYDNNPRSNNRDRGELASFNQFLDSHREIAEQLRKNPSLVDNSQFLKTHPALQSYLQQNPSVRDALKQAPNAFTRQEARYDRNGDEMNRGSNTNMGSNRDDMARRTRSASFGAFLGSHSDVAAKLKEDPTQARNQEFLQQHPELESYLNDHPDVRQDLMADPTNFVKAAQTSTTGVKTTTSPTTTTPSSTNPSATSPTQTKPPKQ